MLLRQLSLSLSLHFSSSLATLSICVPSLSLLISFAHFVFKPSRSVNINKLKKNTTAHIIENKKQKRRNKRRNTQKGMNGYAVYPHTTVRTIQKPAKMRTDSMEFDKYKARQTDFYYRFNERAYALNETKRNKHLEKNNLSPKESIFKH